MTNKSVKRWYGAMHPEITAVVPVYNMGKYLPKAIRCLLSQTYKDFEIIIVDDGSTDGSSEICDEQTKLDDRISVIHKTNGGLSSARNCGIEKAAGRFIIFPDPDDWTESNYLENLIALHHSFHSDVEICAHYVTYDARETPRIIARQDRLYDKSQAMKILMERNGFCGFAWNKLYHLDIIQENYLRFDPELGMAQDLYFAFSYFCCCERIAYSSVPAYHYYQGSGGVTNQRMLTGRKVSGLMTYKKIAELSHEKYPYVEKAAYETMYNMSLSFLYIYIETRCEDATLYDTLRGNLKKYHNYFFESDEFSALRKILGSLAEINPHVSYFLQKLIRKIKGRTGNGNRVLQEGDIS